MKRRRLLWVGDAGCPTGFARATHATLDVLRKTWDVAVLGINYLGDPHPYPYPMYPAMPGGDMFGLGRMVWALDTVRPDVVVLQNDPWNVPLYMGQIRSCKEYANLPVVAALAVDGLNLKGEHLNGLALAIFWTEFGREQAVAGGFRGPTAVVPLGVDLGVYKPKGTPQDARRRSVAKFSPEMVNGFMAGNVNRNQPRKRMDLTIRYFAEWIKSRKIDDAYLYLHVAPTGDTGFDCVGLAKYYGVLNRLALREPAVWRGIPERDMAETYRMFDVLVSTTQGEGFGLTTFEAMACGVPTIVPRWSALGELCKDSSYLVPCTSTATTVNLGRGPVGMAVIGGVPDEDAFIMALDQVYKNKALRADLRARGLETVRQPRYRWHNVGLAFRDALDEALYPKVRRMEGVA